MNTGLSLSRYISDYSFDELMDQYRPYLLKISSTSMNQSHLYEQEDLMQELNMVLWKIWKMSKDAPRCQLRDVGTCRDLKCQDLNELQFRGRIIVALRNRLADIFRRKFVKNEGYEHGHSPDSLEFKSWHVSYESAIKEIMETASDPVREIIKTCIDPSKNMCKEDVSKARKELVEEIL